jgi:Zn finger protein HypA/HybF involved in hydrogenase expression
MKVRMVKWWKECMDCGYREEGETEYMGLNFWYCPKCNSVRIRGGFEIDEKEIASPT